MGRVWHSGFEWNSNIEFINSGGSPEIQSTIKRTGNHAGRISSLSSGTPKFWQQNYIAANNNGPWYFRFYFRYATLPSANNSIFHIQTSSGVMTVRILLANDGTLILEDEDGAIGSPSSALSANTWYRIECEYDSGGGGSSDIVRARIDGVEFAGASNRNIAAGRQIKLGGNLSSEAQTTGEWFFDDIAIDDTAYPGAGGIIHLLPNAAGDNSDWTNDYQAVDEETPDDATTLTASNTLNQIDDHNLAASGLSGATINWVAIQIRFRGAAASANSSFVERIKASSGGTVEESAAISPANASWMTNRTGNTIQNFMLVLSDLPGASSSPWTATDLDAAQIGYRLSSANTNNAQISTICLSIDFIEAQLTISPTSIGSGEAFGSPTVIPDQDVSPSGVASAESFGTATIVIDQFVEPSSVNSAEAFGSVIVANAQTLSPIGVSSAEAFGSPSLTVGSIVLSPSGIASSESFGTPIVYVEAQAQIARPDGVVTLGTWTTYPSLGSNLNETIDEITPNDSEGIQSDNAGTGLVAEVSLSNVDDPSTSANHVVRYRYFKDASGGRDVELIVSLVQGTTVIASWSHLNIPDTPVQLAEQNLTATQANSITNYNDLRLRFTANITGSGPGKRARVSWVEFEVPPAVVFVAPSSIASTENFGSVSVSLGEVNLIPESILTLEAFGSPSVFVGFSVQPSSIDSLELFGTTTLTVGTVNVGPVGIDSSEAFGNHVVAEFQLIVASSIDSLEEFGSPLLITRQDLFPVSIDSATRFGTPSLSGFFNYEEWIVLPTKYNVILAEMWPYRVFNKAGWTLDSSSTYWATFPDSGETLEAVKVFNGNSALIKRGSVDSVKSNPGSWFHDRTTSRVYVRLVDSTSPNLTAIRVFYQLNFATKIKENGEIIEFLGKPYFPWVSSDSNYAVDDVLPDFFASTSSMPVISINILNPVDSFSGFGFLDKLLARDHFENIDVRFRHGDGGTDLQYSQHKVIGSFVTRSRPAVDRLGIMLELVTNARILNHPLPPKRFNLVDHPNALPSIIGKTIPISLGHHTNVPAYCINTTTGQYQVNDGPLSFGILSVKEAETGVDVSYTADNANGKFTVSGWPLRPILGGIGSIEGGSFVAPFTRRFASTALDANENESLPSTVKTISLSGSQNAFVIECEPFLPGAKSYRIYMSSSPEGPLDKWVDIGLNRRHVVKDGEEFTPGSLPTVNKFVPELVSTISTVGTRSGRSWQTSGDALWYIFKQYLGQVDDKFNFDSFDESDFYWNKALRVYLGRNGDQITVNDFIRQLEQSCPIGRFYIDNDGKFNFKVVHPVNSHDIEFQEIEILDVQEIPDKVLPIHKLIVNRIPAVAPLGEQWYATGKYEPKEFVPTEFVPTEHSIEQTLNTYLADEASVVALGNTLMKLVTQVPRRLRLPTNAKSFLVRAGMQVKLSYGRATIFSDLILSKNIFLVRKVTLDYNRASVPIIEVDNWMSAWYKHGLRSEPMQFW